MKYILSAELDKVLDQLRHFCGTFRRISGIVPYHSVFFPRVEAVMSLMSPILGLSGAFHRFFSFSLFIACIVLIAHIFVELKSEME